ncbi:MAG TPA: hypothetical protein VFU94_06060 [Conexibacter sp.]|nr:hypothetical protein [Conexibacter sp.]
MRLTSSNWRVRVATFTSAALLSLTTVAVAALSAALYPRRLPPLHDARVVDVVFGSQPVIWAARLLFVSLACVLAVGGAFVVVSAVARMRNGDWLRRAGPFEVSEARVAELEDEAYFWKSAARDCYDEIERINEADENITTPTETATYDDDYDTI